MKNNVRLKTSWKLAGIVCLTVLLLAAIPGCGSKSALIGTWESTSTSGNFIQFVEDGRLIVVIDQLKVVETYEIVDDTHVKVTLTNLDSMWVLPFATESLTYSINDKKLTLQGDKDVKYFTRVR